MKSSYYPMKRRLGGEKFTLRDKLCFKWYPTPGCIMHEKLIGDRRAEILFEHYVNLSNKANLIYWRTHPAEWKQISAGTRSANIIL